MVRGATGRGGEDGGGEGLPPDLCPGLQAGALWMEPPSERSPVSDAPSILGRACGGRGPVRPP